MELVNEKAWWAKAHVRAESSNKVEFAKGEVTRPSLQRGRSMPGCPGSFLLKQIARNMPAA